MTKHEKWIAWIQEQMQFVVPPSLRAIKYQPKDGDIRQTFYESVCNRACLNGKSHDVLEAFSQLYPLRKETKL